MAGFVVWAGLCLAAEAGFDDPVRHPPEVSPGDEVTRGGGDGVGSDRGRPQLESHGQPIVAVDGEEPILASIDNSQISEAIGRQVDSLRTCYEKELQQDPTLAGKVALSFTITQGRLGVGCLGPGEHGEQRGRALRGGPDPRDAVPPDSRRRVRRVNYPFVFAPPPAATAAPAEGATPAPPP